MDHANPHIGPAKPLISPAVLSRDFNIERLQEEICTLAAHIAAAKYQLMLLIWRLDEMKGWQGPGIRSLAHWLNWRTGMNIISARETVRVARALPELPKISAAFEKGELSFSKVRAMTRVATSENEAALLQLAHSSTASHIESIVRGYKKTLSLKDANQAHANRSLSTYFDDDGSLVINGRVPAEVGALLVKAIDCAKREAFDNGEPLENRADALAIIAESFLATGSKAKRGGERNLVQIVVNPETLRQRTKNVSAETRPTQRQSAAKRETTNPSEMTDAPNLNENVSAETHDEHYCDSHASPTMGVGADASIGIIDDGGALTAETARRIACDASLLAVYENCNGEPLSIGRRTRAIPPAIERAVRRRDQHCCFPGCTHTKFVDLHHIHHWADGGETSMDNLMLLCREHHRLLHEGGYEVVRNVGIDKDNRQLRFFDAYGCEVPPCEKRFRGNAGVIIAANPHIDHRTLPPEWYGEPLDLCSAVGAIIEHETPAAAYPSRPPD